MVEKLAVNKQREWPELKDGEPRLHIKTEQHQRGEVMEPQLEYAIKRIVELENLLLVEVGEIHSTEFQYSLYHFE
ncbi:hypothetical protein WC1_01581 [Citrobacter sp. KTE30]|nr:hypothetical protein WC1_01581 [Citrobacter sp. KTE30]